MKNVIKITEDGEALLSSTDDGTNRLIINDSEIDPTDWVGTGSYTATVEGHSITVAKVSSNTGNIGIRKLDSYSYELYINKEHLVVDGDITAENLTVSDSITADKVIADSMSVNDISSDITITKSSGNWSVSNIAAVRCGNVVNIAITFKGNGSAVSGGSNGFVGTISGAVPLVNSIIMTYYGDVIVAAAINTDGSITVRVTNSVTLSSTGETTLRGTYIVGD